MKDKLIWCDTKDKLANVIAKLVKDGYSADSVDRMWESYGDKVTVRVRKEFKDITFASRSWYEGNNFGTPITADEFLDKKPSIVIFRRGRNVIAKDVTTGNEGIAKCSPDDCFVFKTGASIAMARLMAKTPDALNHDVKDEWVKALGLTPVEKKSYTDADRNFKVGDRVVVRDWDDMANEFKYIDGGIRKSGCFTSFIDSMRHLCGRTATVVRVYEVDRVEVNFDDKSGNINYFYRSWMFNPIDSAQSKNPEAKFKVGDHVTLKEGFVAGMVYGGLVLHEGAMHDNAYNKRMTIVRVDWSDDSNTYYYECKGDSRFTFHYSEEMLDKWDESKIHEGDKVRIKKGCTGNRFDLYYEWVKEHISDPDLLLAFERGDHIDTSLDYEVVKIAPHKVQSRTLAYIKYKDDYRTLCYLFDIEALEKV